MQTVSDWRVLFVKDFKSNSLCHITFDDGGTMSLRFVALRITESGGKPLYFDVSTEHHGCFRIWSDEIVSLAIVGQVEIERDGVLGAPEVTKYAYNRPEDE